MKVIALVITDGNTAARVFAVVHGSLYRNRSGLRVTYFCDTRFGWIFPIGLLLLRLTSIYTLSKALQ